MIQIKDEEKSGLEKFRGGPGGGGSPRAISSDPTIFNHVANIGSLQFVMFINRTDFR